MESEEIIRAYMRKPKDRFKLGFSIFKVAKIKNGRIYYKRIDPINNWVAGDPESMGANSQEKLILITNKTKQNEHQNRSGNFSKS